MKKRLMAIALLWLLSLGIQGIQGILGTAQQGIVLWTAMACFALGLGFIVQLWQGEQGNHHWRKLAHRDDLTQLLNRRGLLATALASPYCVLLLDIDQFKAINDTHGHATGDAVLQHLANNLATHSRRGDYCARWGGDEFVIILAGANKASAAAFVRRLQRHLPNNAPVPYSVTIGIADSSEAEGIAALIASADTDLLKQKSR